MRKSKNLSVSTAIVLMAILLGSALFAPTLSAYADKGNDKPPKGNDKPLKGNDSPKNSPLTNNNPPKADPPKADPPKNQDNDKGKGNDDDKGKGNDDDKGKGNSGDEQNGDDEHKKSKKDPEHDDNGLHLGCIIGNHFGNDKYEKECDDFKEFN